MNTRSKKKNVNKRSNSITHSSDSFVSHHQNNNNNNNNNNNIIGNNLSSSFNGLQNEKNVQNNSKHSQQLWEINSVLSGNLFFKVKKTKLSFDNSDLTSSDNGNKLKGNERWKLCWFILKDGHLLCFREKNPKECFPIHSFYLKSAIISQYSLKSSISLFQDPSLSPTSPSSPSSHSSAFVEETPSPYYFSLLVYSGSVYHSYQFCCKVEVDLNRWVNSISFVIKNCNLFHSSINILLFILSLHFVIIIIKIINFYFFSNYSQFLFLFNK